MKSIGQVESLAGVRIVPLKRFEDLRGNFVKLGEEAFPLPTRNARDEFCSLSRRDVLRGMHFQTPPFDHAKRVVCMTGKILDVLVDLRTDSATCGAHMVIQLSADKPEALFIPTGVAHGFLSLQDDTLMHYLTTSAHHGPADAGILWDSFGFRWPVENPILSSRDAGFVRFEDFASPFGRGAHG